MLANNIWELIGKLIELALAPYEAIRLGSENWWSSNIISWIFIGVFFIALIYWMKQMFSFKKTGKEDTA